MIFNYPSKALPNATYTINSYCDSSESYRTNPIITGEWFTGTGSSGKKTGLITNFYPPSNPNGRFGWYISTDSYGRQSIISAGTNDCGIYYSINGGTPQTSGQIPSDIYNYDYELYFDNAVFETNMPIFDTYEHKEAYVNAATDAEALEILEQYAVNYKKDICYVSCVALPQPPDPSYLFNYENLTIPTIQDVVDTGIKWDTDTFSGKSWRIELKYTKSSGGEQGIFYFNNVNNASIVTSSGGYLQYYNSNLNPKYTTLYSNIIKGTDNIALEYDGNGTLDIYIDDVKVNTITNFDAGFVSGTASVNVKIGAYQTVERFQGTFEYIRMKFLD